MNKAQEIINNMIIEYPNDYVVIAKNNCDEYFISTAFTYYEGAQKQYKRYLDKLDINFKISIRQLNKQLLKDLF